MPRAYGFRHADRDFYTSLRFSAGGTVAITSTAQFAAGPFTISAWVWPDSFAAEQTIIGSATANAPVVKITTGGQVSLSLAGGATIATSVGGLQPREWAHVAVRYDAGATRFFINGEDAGAANTAGAFVQASSMTVALSAGSAICELAAHASALTQDAVRSMFYMGAMGAPVMRFRFADAVGSVASDAAGSGSGAITSCSFAPWLVPTAPRLMPRAMGSVRLSAATDYIGLIGANAYSSRFNGSAKIMMAGWARIHTGGILVCSRGGTVRGYLQSGNNTSFGVFRSQDADTGQGAANARHFFNTPRQWHFCATVADFENDTVTNYVNGVAFDRQSVAFGAGALNLTSGDLRIGQDSNGTGGIVGLVGPIYVCGGNITNQMVRDLYLTGKVPSVDKVAYWDMTGRSGTAVTQGGNLSDMGATLVGGAAWSLEVPL